MKTEAIKRFTSRYEILEVILMETGESIKFKQSTAIDIFNRYFNKREHEKYPITGISKVKKLSTGEIFERKEKLLFISNGDQSHPYHGEHRINMFWINDHGNIVCSTNKTDSKMRNLINLDKFKKITIDVDDENDDHYII